MLDPITFVILMYVFFVFSFILGYWWKIVEPTNEPISKEEIDKVLGRVDRYEQRTTN